VEVIIRMESLRGSQHRRSHSVGRNTACEPFYCPAGLMLPTNMMFTQDSDDESGFHVADNTCSKESEFEVLGGVQITYEEQLDATDPLTRSLNFRNKDKDTGQRMSLTLKAALKADPIEEDLHRIQSLMKQRAQELALLKKNEDSNSEVPRLRGEIAKLKAEVRHYERQNSELRKEIQLSSGSLAVEHQRQMELKEEVDQLRDNYSKLCEMLKELVLQLDDNCEDLEDPKLLVNNIGSSLQLLLSRHRRMSTHYEHLLSDNRKLSREIEALKKQIKVQATEHVETVVQLSGQLQSKELNLQQAKIQLNAMKRQSLKLQKVKKEAGEKFWPHETPFNSPCMHIEDEKSEAGSEEQTKPGTITSSQETSRRHNRASSDLAQWLPPPPPTLEQASKVVHRSVSPIADKGFLSKLRAKSKESRRKIKSPRQVGSQCR